MLRGQEAGRPWVSTKDSAVTLRGPCRGLGRRETQQFAERQLTRGGGLLGRVDQREVQHDRSLRAAGVQKEVALPGPPPLLQTGLHAGEGQPLGAAVLLRLLQRLSVGPRGSHRVPLCVTATPAPGRSPREDVGVGRTDLGILPLSSASLWGEPRAQHHTKGPDKSLGVITGHYSFPLGTDR